MLGMFSERTYSISRPIRQADKSATPLITTTRHKAAATVQVTFVARLSRIERSFGFRYQSN
jgi:hypothetical protein